MTVNPDTIVAEKIIAALREKKLLTEQRLNGLEQKLSAGDLDAGDWRILVELDDKKVEEEHDDSKD